jgi:chemotaxis protein CheZ
MPVRQKIFRIESTQAGYMARSAPAADKGSNEDILAEIKALRELIQCQAPATPSGPPLPASDRMTIGELNKLKHETDSIHRAITRTMQELAELHFGVFNDGAGGGHAGRQLDAVVAGTERATQQILEAAEGIDEAANTLSAALKSEQEHALATDIRDHVVRIFEACNFQDLTGQRISKVLATLQFVENSVARMMEIWGGHEVIIGYADARVAERSDKKLVNGPKLDGEAGHASQQEIDAMFA